MWKVHDEKLVRQKKAEAAERVGKIGCDFGEIKFREDSSDETDVPGAFEMECFFPICIGGLAPGLVHFLLIQAPLP